MKTNYFSHNLIKLAIYSKLREKIAEENAETVVLPSYGGTALKTVGSFIPGTAGKVVQTAGGLYSAGRNTMHAANPEESGGADAQAAAVSSAGNAVGDAAYLAGLATGVPISPAVPILGTAATTFHAGNRRYTSGTGKVEEYLLNNLRKRRNHWRAIMEEENYKPNEEDKYAPMKWYEYPSMFLEYYPAAIGHMMEGAYEDYVDIKNKAKENISKKEKETGRPLTSDEVASEVVNTGQYALSSDFEKNRTSRQKGHVGFVDKGTAARLKKEEEECKKFKQKVKDLNREARVFSGPKF